MQTDIPTKSAHAPASTVEILLKVTRAAAAWLERNRERINALNVFPVPDGDTGDNMMLTVRGALKALEARDPVSLADACDALTEGALQGSRGNSGVILSQMLAGFAGAIREANEVTPQSLAAAFLRAAEEGLKAHSEPVEGTMMTVMHDVAREAEALAGQGLPLEAFLQAVLRAARESVVRTQTLLPRLQQAGVVDAGGEGIAVLLEGVVRYIGGESLEGAIAATQVADLDSLDAMEEDAFGYCTNFLLQGEGIDVDGFRAAVLDLGRSALVVGNSRSVKVHVHTEQPGEILSRALRLGTLHQLKIDNMDDQYLEVRRVREEARPRAVATALVAVAAGEGFKRLFEQDARAVVVAGGQSANPSTGDMAAAIESAPGEDVVLLPNNPNVIMSARKAAENCRKRVSVLPTKSMPAGVAASLAYNPDASLERNVEAMRAATEGVASIEVTRAVRDAEVEGVRVRQGEYIGLVDDKLVASGPSLTDALTGALERAGVEERELLTLYGGADAGPEDADQATAAVGERWPDLEVEVHHGGQPFYAFVASLE